MSSGQYTSGAECGGGPAVVSEYALGRTALMIGLRALGLNRGDTMLAPDYLCDVVWHGAARAGVRVAPFALNDDLTPVWDELEASAGMSGARALMMVHYFGQPQDVERHRAFCAKHGLFLVEDNAHGHGGALGKDALGTFGDIGIASPRKILGTPSGGLLFSKRPFLPEDLDPLPQPVTRLPARIVRAALSRFPRVKGRVRGLLDIRKDWADPRLYREEPARDALIDPRSSRRIARADWPAVGRGRRYAWEAWSALAGLRGLKPVFARVHPESCPWALPLYASDERERDGFLKWGTRHGVTMFTWPALPEPIIDANASALERWKRIVCISLDRAP